MWITNIIYSTSLTHCCHHTSLNPSALTQAQAMYVSRSNFTIKLQRTCNHINIKNPNSDIELLKHCINTDVTLALP